MTEVAYLGSQTTQRENLRRKELVLYKCVNKTCFDICGLVNLLVKD